VNLSGIFSPIPTPFRNDAVDHRALTENVDRWMRTPLAGLVVLGSNGEAPLLQDDEADDVIETVRSRVPHGRPLIAGAGRESTAATIAAAKRAAARGADVVLVRTPSFFKNVMNGEAFIRHYTAVADASPAPVMLYNVTVYTGVNLLPETVEELSQHSNIVGMKESNSDIVQLSETISRTPDDFVVLCGSILTLYASLTAGAQGAVLGPAAVIPELCDEMLNCVRQQRHADALALQRRVTPLGRLFGSQYGVAGLKFALDQMGYYGGPTRPPLGSVTADAQRQILVQLGALGCVAV
jgi:4-hydroxy-2-oxoglutarate aldolase